MIAQEYKKMLGAKSVIREMAQYAAKRGQEIGYENVFDYSLEIGRASCRERV